MLNASVVIIAADIGYNFEYKATKWISVGKSLYDWSRSLYIAHIFKVNFKGIYCIPKILFLNFIYRQFIVQKKEKSHQTHTHT